MRKFRKTSLDWKFDLINRHEVKRSMFGDSQVTECRYCRNKLHYRHSTIEHKIPKSKGGGDGKNLAISCVRCNQLKDRMTDHEFMIIIKNLNYCLQQTNIEFLKIYIDRLMNLKIERVEKRLKNYFGLGD